MKLIYHKGKVDFEKIAERRLLENLQLSPEERIDKMFALMELSAIFKKGAIKNPQGLGIVLKEKK